MADPKRLKWGRQTTCSRTCSYRARSESLRTAVDAVCATCATAFKRWPCKAKRVKHGSVYCSRKCQYAGRGLGLTPRIVERRYVITPAGRASWIRAAARRVGMTWAAHWLTCRHCDKRFNDPGYGRRRKTGLTFCSLACCNTYRVGANHPAWQGGHPKYYGKNWRPAQRAVRARDGQQCRRCLKHVVGRYPDIHHIRPVRTFARPELSNYLTNLVSLCHPCHQRVERSGLDFQWP